MMIIMRSNATEKQISDVVRVVQANGLRAHLSQGEERTVIGAIGDGRPVDKGQFLYLPGVDRIVPIHGGVVPFGDLVKVTAPPAD